MTADNYMLANESNPEPSSLLVPKSLVGREISHHCKYSLVTNEGTTKTCPVSSFLNGKKMVAVQGNKYIKYTIKHGNFPYFFRMDLLPRKEKRDFFFCPMTKAVCLIWQRGEHSFFFHSPSKMRIKNMSKIPEIQN